MAGVAAGGRLLLSGRHAAWPSAGRWVVPRWLREPPTLASASGAGLGACAALGQQRRWCPTTTTTARRGRPGKMRACAVVTAAAGVTPDPDQTKPITPVKYGLAHSADGGGGAVGCGTPSTTTFRSWEFYSNLGFDGTIEDADGAVVQHTRGDTVGSARVGDLVGRRRHKDKLRRLMDGTIEDVDGAVVQHKRGHKDKRRHKDKLRRLMDWNSPASVYPLAREVRRRVVLHVGPTNSGKTHRAVQALLEAGTGVYAAPLRLLVGAAVSHLPPPRRLLPLFISLSVRDPMSPCDTRSPGR